MRSVAWLCLCVISVCQAATRNVTVLVNFEKPHSAVSVEAFRRELRTLLAPAGIEADVMLKSEMPVSPQFSELVVFEMKGVCSMDPGPVMVDERGPIDEREPLAMAYSSDGQVLHFGEVECDRVRRCLQRITRGVHPEQHQAQYGTALGIVVAHEIYHMIAGAKAHTKEGLTKASLSARELLDGELTMPNVVRAALRR
jgi:hypothetical protein